MTMTPKLARALTGHTPGPWRKLHERSSWVMGDFRGKEMHIADIRGVGCLTGKGHGAHGMSGEDANVILEANHNLVIASPDLLAGYLAMVEENERLRAERDTFMEIATKQAVMIAAHMKEPKP